MFRLTVSAVLTNIWNDMQQFQDSEIPVEHQDVFTSVHGQFGDVKQHMSEMGALGHSAAEVPGRSG